MSESRNDKNGKILIEYYNGIISNEVLQKMEYDLKNIEIGFSKRDKSNTVFASLEDYTSQIVLFLSNDIVQAYSLGLITNATYDALKTSILNILDSIKGKKLTRISAGPTIEEKEATFGLKVKVGEHNTLDIRLSGEFSEELQGKIVDQAFEIMKMVKQNTPSENMHDYYAEFDIEQEGWDLVNVHEELYKIAQAQSQRIGEANRIDKSE